MTAVPDGLRAPGAPAGLAARGSVHLTLPLATWLGHASTPGQVAGFGPVDGTDARALAAALETHPGTTWCLTLTGRDGRPLAHGCARAAPPEHQRPRAGGRSRAGPHPSTPGPQQPFPPVRPTTATRQRLATGSRDRPEPRPPTKRTTGPRDGPGTNSPTEPGASTRDRSWTFTMTLLDAGGCGHAWETPAYQPSAALRHLAQIRHATCAFPGCRRPATQCDADHTLAYDHGGRTCLCNLAPLCRHHHQVKQATGWALEQASPGVLTWTTPAGRAYTVTPTEYPG